MPNFFSSEHMTEDEITTIKRVVEYTVAKETYDANNYIKKTKNRGTTNNDESYPPPPITDYMHFFDGRKLKSEISKMLRKLSRTFYLLYLGCSGDYTHSVYPFFDDSETAAYALEVMNKPHWSHYDICVMLSNITIGWHTMEIDIQEYLSKQTKGAETPPPCHVKIPVYTVDNKSTGMLELLTSTIWGVHCYVVYLQKQPVNDAIQQAQANNFHPWEGFEEFLEYYSQKEMLLSWSDSRNLTTEIILKFLKIKM